MAQVNEIPKYAVYEVGKSGSSFLCYETNVLQHALNMAGARMAKGAISTFIRDQHSHVPARISRPGPIPAEAVAAPPEAGEEPL